MKNKRLDDILSQFFKSLYISFDYFIRFNCLKQKRFILFIANTQFKTLSDNFVVLIFIIVILIINNSGAKNKSNKKIMKIKVILQNQN